MAQALASLDYHLVTLTPVLENSLSLSTFEQQLSPSTAWVQFELPDGNSYYHIYPIS